MHAQVCTGLMCPFDSRMIHSTRVNAEKWILETRWRDGLSAASLKHNVLADMWNTVCPCEVERHDLNLSSPGKESTAASNTQDVKLLYI